MTRGVHMNYWEYPLRVRVADAAAVRYRDTAGLGLWKLRMRLVFLRVRPRAR